MTIFNTALVRHKRSYWLSFTIILCFAHCFFNSTCLEAQSLGIGPASAFCSATSADGRLFMWGDDTFSQLGNGAPSSANVPQEISSMGELAGKTIVSVANGSRYTIALATDGTVYAWGYGEFGQLGDGSFGTGSSIPVQVEGLSGIKAIAAGANHCLAISADNKLYAWGRGDEGQLGNGLTANAATPILINGLSEVKFIAAGVAHSIAIVGPNDEVYAWGHGNEGQLGNGSFNTFSTVPVLIQSLSGVKAIAAGAYHCLAIGADDRVYSWGHGYWGQLGNGNFHTSAPFGVAVPVAVQNIEGLKAISAGYYHSLALGINGQVYAWGNNPYGQLGNGTTASSASPVQVQGLPTIKNISAGAGQCLAIGNSNEVYAWGYGQNGELGNGTNTNSTIPVKVSGIFPPVLDMIGNKVVSELSLLSFQIEATKYTTSENTLVYSLAAAASGIYPSGASITEAGIINWVPTEAHGPGTYRVKIVVADGTLKDEEEISIQVTEVNVTPILGTIDTKAVDELSELTFTATAIDADHPANTLTYSLVDAPAGATISAAGDFSWTPTEIQGPGNYNFKVKVSDDGNPTMTDEKEVSVTVSEVNVAPKMTTIGNKTVAVDANLTFTVFATDEDIPAQSLIYSASSLPAGATFNTTSQTFSWTPTGKQIGDHNITFRSSDGALLGEEVVKITVVKPGSLRSPSIKSFSPSSGAVGTRVIITGNNFAGATDVSFNGTAATFTVQGASKINATVPLGATTGKISVTTPGGTATSNSDFSVISTSAVSALQAAESTQTIVAYPNPFFGKAVIRFSLEKEENYSLNIFDIRGSLVRKLSEGRAEANKQYEFELDGEDMADGLYITRLTTDSKERSLKLILKK